MSIAISKDHKLAIYNNHTGKIIFLNAKNNKLIEGIEIDPLFPDERSYMKFSNNNKSLYLWGGYSDYSYGIEKIT